MGEGDCSRCECPGFKKKSGAKDKDLCEICGHYGTIRLNKQYKQWVTVF